MKKIYFIALLLAYSFSLFSQSEEDQDFRVTLKDLKMASYLKDSTANAVVLYEYGKSFVDPTHFDLRTEEKHKVKIFNKDGFDQATITLHLYNKGSNSYEDITNITATTYNIENDNVTTSTLDKNDIYREVYDENHTLVKFTLPNIKEGSVITYSFTRKSPFMFNYKGWDFQSDIPKVYSEYNASIPGNWDYNIKLIGGKKLAINESEVKKECLYGSNGAIANCFVARYAMKDMPAFVEEDYMTNKSNYLARIEYELKTFTQFDGTITQYTKTWEAVEKELRKEKNIGRQLAKSIKVEDILPSSIINEINPLIKAKSIYQFVQKNYTWNEKFKIFSDVSVKDLIEDKSGNATAINILLKILLDETGIETLPVLLSTRHNGFATKIFPVISEFNYLIVQANIQGKDYLLDATDNYLSFGQLPFRCLNQYARLLDFDKGSKWIDIVPQSPSNVFYSVEMDFDEEQKLIGNVKSKRTGYHALNYKKAYYPNPDSYVESLINMAPFLEIFNHEVKNKNLDSEDFIEEYNVEYNLEDAGDNLYLNPFFVTFF